MSLDINLVLHKWDFDLDTRTLGVIRCGPLNKMALPALDKQARTPDINGETLARYLLKVVGHKLIGEQTVDDECDGPALNDDEIASITRDELDVFCDNIITCCLQPKPVPQFVKKSQRADKFDCDHLPKTVIDYIDAQRARTKGIINRAQSGLFDDSVSKAVRQNDMFSDRLGESIAALRVPQMPPNPVHKTNKALETLVGNIEHLRPVLSNCAALIQSMNSTAREMQAAAIESAKRAEIESERAMRVARNSVLVATAGILISIVATGFSIYYARESISVGRQYGDLSPTAKDLNEQVSKLAAAAKDDRAALAAAAEKDRAMFAKAIRANSKAGSAAPGKMR